MINIAQYGLIIILPAVLVFHFLVLLKVIPYKIVWGGRLKSDTQMYRFEVVSIFTNLIFLAIVFAYSGILLSDISPNIISILLWIMAALFSLNTLGNLMSKNKWEKIIFTPLTFILFIFCLILALN